MTEWWGIRKGSVDQKWQRTKTKGKLLCKVYVQEYKVYLEIFTKFV